MGIIVRAERKSEFTGRLHRRAQRAYARMAIGWQSA